MIEKLDKEAESVVDVEVERVVDGISEGSVGS